MLVFWKTTSSNTNFIMPIASTTNLLSRVLAGRKGYWALHAGHWLKMKAAFQTFSCKMGNNRKVPCTKQRNILRETKK